MKTILISLTIMLSACNADHRPVITGKEFMRGNKPCICDYWYTGIGKLGDARFQDSCSKYSIGDTIK